MSVKISVNQKETMLDLSKNMTLEDLIKLFPTKGIIYIDLDDILPDSKNKDVDVIRTNVMKLYGHQCLNKYTIEEVHYKNTVKCNLNKLTGTKYFIGRYGIIELRMVENYLKYGTEYIKNINDIFAEYNLTKFKEYEKKYQSFDWMGFNGPERAVLNICTMAGFYCTSNNYSDNEDALKEFCELYLDGLKNMTYLSRCPQCKWWYLYINKFYEHKDEIQLDLNIIFDLTDRKNICFISYFADNIKDLYDNGKIYKLYKTRNFTFDKLYAIKSYITTYGNNPHSSWPDTFNVLCNKIDDLVKNESIDLFLINAGCYGIPLANYVYTKHNISVIHEGHALNSYFGILTTKNNLDLDDINKENFIEVTKDLFYKDTKSLEYWNAEGYWK